MKSHPITFTLIQICIFTLMINTGACQVPKRSKSASEIFSDVKVAALADAAASGKVDEIDRLIKNGVTIDGLSKHGMTPLLFALSKKNLRGAEALLKAGANPNHAIESPSEIGGRPMILLFITTDAVDIVELLLKYGANPNTRNPEKVNGNDFNVGQSLLYQAVMYKPMVNLLVKYGADVNLKSLESESPLASAAGLGQLDVVDFLLDHGANDFDALAQSLQERIWGESIEPHRLAILRRLHKQGVKIYAAEQTPQTPADLISPGKWRHIGLEEQRK